MADEIEKMIGEKPEEEDEEEAPETVQAGAGAAPEGEETAEKLKEQKRTLVEQIKRRQENERVLKARIRELEAAKTEPKTESKVEEQVEELQSMTPAQLREAAKGNPAAKAWLDLIREEANAAMKPVRDGAYRTAVAKFAAQHPEYAATAEGRARFREVEAIAKRNGLDAAGDEESMLDILNRSKSYHSPNVPAKDEGKARAKQFAAKAAAPAGGVRDTETDYSSEEVEAAGKAGMTPEEYRAASSVYGAGNRIGL